MSKTTTDRAFEILDLIDETRPTVSPEEIAQKLGLTRSTTYRYLKVLCGIGLLMQIGRGAYSLGPRIVELERKIQISDPLLAAGRKVMPEHAAKVPSSVLILCGLWGDRVLCLRQEPATHHELQLSRARGLPFPLFKGAASLAILANLSPARIKSLYLYQSSEIAEAGLGDSWDGFRRRMSDIRRCGYCVTTGTFESNLAAIAAPVFSDEGTILGSLTRVMPKGEGDPDAQLIEGVRQAAHAITGLLSSEVLWMPPVEEHQTSAHDQFLKSLIS